MGSAVDDDGGSMRGRSIDVSFVIPVRNDEDRLRQCLQSIQAAAYPLDRIEIIVVDDASGDASAAVAQAAGARLLRAAGGGVGRLRNMGAAVARGRLLAFVDADHVLASGWIRAAVESCREDAAIGAVGALCHAPHNGTWVQRAYDRLRGRQAGCQPVEWLGAGNLVVVRTAFERIEGFDTGLETCEDVDLCKKLRSAGYRLMSDDRLMNVHLGDPTTLKALFCGELWRGRSNLAVSLRRPVTARELPSVLVPVLQLAGVGVTISSIAFGGRAGVVVAVAGLLPLALLPALRAVRMSGAGQRFDARHFPDNVAVAYAYDCARALALVAFAGHGTRRQ